MKLIIFLFASICLVGTASATNSPGLNYKYYEGTWNSLPDFNSIMAIKNGITANFDLGIRNSDVTYGIVWEGFITIPVAGDYTFETSSDDGSQLFINNISSPLVNNDGIHPAAIASGTIHLNAGNYPIKVTFFQNIGGHNMKVYWSSNTASAMAFIFINHMS